MGRNQQILKLFHVGLGLAFALSWVVAGGATVHAQASAPPGHSEAVQAAQREPEVMTLQLAEEDLKRSKSSVGRFTIESNPAEVNVSVDGDRVELPSDRKLLLNVGTRLVEVGAADYESQHLQLIVKGGEDRKLSFTLEPSSAWYANPWVWIGAGVLIAGATAAIVVSAASDSDGGGVAAPGRMGP